MLFSFAIYLHVALLLHEARNVCAEGNKGAHRLVMLGRDFSSSTCVYYGMVFLSGPYTGQLARNFSATLNYSQAF